VSTSEKNAAGQARKAYHTPVIRHYGAIRAITEAVGMMSANSDGAKKGGNRKTN
jgi:hypothetical protein